MNVKPQGRNFMSIKQSLHVLEQLDKGESVVNGANNLNVVKQSCTVNMCNNSTETAFYSFFHENYNYSTFLDIFPFTSDGSDFWFGWGSEREGVYSSCLSYSFFFVCKLLLSFFK